MRRSAILRSTVLASCVVATVALAGCSSDDSSSPAAQSVPSAPSASFPGVAATGDGVKIGLINNEGGQAISSPENRLAAQAAAKYANAELGGIGGRPIDLVICKETEEPSSARDCANQMVEAKVSAVVVTTTGLGDVMVPIITGAGIPYVAASGQSIQELTGDNVFLWTGGFPQSLAAMAENAKSKGITSVTAFTIDLPAAVNGLRSIGSAVFGAAGVKLDIVTIPPGTPDPTPQISAGIAGNPGGVAIVGESTFCTSTLKSLGTLGFSGEKMAIQACATPDVQRAVGSSIEGTEIFTAALTDGDSPEASLYRAVIAKYEPETDISGYAYVGYQGVLGLVRATRSVTGSDTSPAAIISAIRAAKSVTLPAGDGLTFTCDGTANPQLKSVCGKGSIVATLKDGKLSDAQVVP